jgi:hypothetical protein
MDGRRGGSGRVCLSVCLYYYVISLSSFSVGGLRWDDGSGKMRDSDYLGTEWLISVRVTKLCKSNDGVSYLFFHSGRVRLRYTYG